MQNRNDKELQLEAPPKLVAALKQLPRESVFVPPTVDEALMKAARQHLGQPDKKRAKWFRLIPWTAATAGFAAAVLLAFPHAKDFLGFGQSKNAVRRGWKDAGGPGLASQSEGPAFAREDVNRDGAVDILDAFLIARKLQVAPSFDRKLDVNGDGVIDHRDIDAIAARAVSLEKRGRS